MNCVVVGADRLGNIPELLEALGIRIADHITGRAASHQRDVVRLPSDTDLLILFTDFLNHNAMRSYRRRAQAQGIRVLACRRSASCLVMEIRRLFGELAIPGLGRSN
ncbi:MAG: DUF2325 domain-containing protein [Gammaproteobacteria bacterium]